MTGGEGRLSGPLRGGLVIFIGQGVLSVGTLIGMRLVTGAVSPVVFGSLVLGMGIVALAHQLAVNPTLQALLKFAPTFNSEPDRAQLWAAALDTLARPVALAAFAVACLTSLVSAASGGDVLLGPACGILLMVDSWRTVRVTKLNADGAQAATAILLAVDAWLRPLGAVLFTFALGPSAWSAALGYAAGSASAAVVQRLLRMDTTPLSTLSVNAGESSKIRELQQKLSSFARPLILLPIAGWLSGQADRYVIGSLDGIAQAGIYAALYGLASRPFLVYANAAELTFRQAFYGAELRGDRELARNILLKWLTVALAGGTLILGLIVLLHTKIESLFLAPDYRGHSSLMIWIATGYIFLTASNVLERVSYSRGHPHLVSRNVVMSTVAGILITTTMVLSLGFRGAAFAVPLYFALQLSLALRSVLLRQRLPDTTATPSQR